MSLNPQTPVPSTPPLGNWFDEQSPWKSGFISLMRAIAARNSHLPLPGSAALPDLEPFRIGQIPHMVFAPREISHVWQEATKIHLQLFSLGVWGPQGAMPLHLTELAYSHTESHDTALIDFVNIFHHRALSLFYRAWALSQDTASLDRRYNEKFSFYIGSLTGLDPQELKGSVLPLHARLASSAHLIREARNPEGVVGALHYYFEVPVQIEEYVQQWLSIEPDNRSRLGYGRETSKLGDGAILGETVIDKQHKFKLVFGPLTLKQYLQFSPWGEDLPVLREWVRNFVGFEYAWEVSLVLAADEVPCVTLDGSHQLGYASWLEREDRSTPLAGMSFEPEVHREGLLAC